MLTAPALLQQSLPDHQLLLQPSTTPRVRAYLQIHAAVDSRLLEGLLSGRVQLPLTAEVDMATPVRNTRTWWYTSDRGAHALITCYNVFT